MGPFKLAMVFLFLEVFVPGYLILRCFRFPRTWSVCLAPVVTVGAVAIWCQALAFLGIFASPLSVLLPLCALAAVLFLVLERNRSDLQLPDLGWGEVLLYGVIGIVLGYTLYVQLLPTGEYIYVLYDVTQHLNLVKAFADSGHMSSLGTSAYLTAADVAIDPTPNRVFYPAAYHTMCALLVQGTSCSVPMSLNVATVVFCFVAYPVSMLAFLAVAFPNNRKVRLAGSVSCLALIACPWITITWGPVYPNLTAMNLLPGAMAIFVLLFSAERRRREYADMALALLVSVVAIGLLHPNGVFAAIVTLTPFCIGRLWRLPQTKGKALSRRLLPPVAFGVLVLVFWTLCYKLPAFQGTVWENWPAYAHPVQALVNILTLSFSFGRLHNEYAIQLVPGIMVIIGLVKLLHRRDERWLAVAYVAWCVFCYVGMTSEGELKHYLTGFWYTDQVRVAAFAALCAVPLVAAGLVWVLDDVTALVTQYNAARKAKTHPAKIAVVVLALFVAGTFVPSFDLPAERDATPPQVITYLSDGENALIRNQSYPAVRTTFGDWQMAVQEQYAFVIPFTKPERAFANRVAKVTGDELVINDPMDGSYFAYSACDVRCYYRNFIGVGDTNETEASKAIRLHLSEYATNPEVQEAVKQTGATYVMKLKLAWSDLSSMNLRGDFNFDDFAGIQAIQDDTPGFQRVLESPGCTLYRIVPTA